MGHTCFLAKFLFLGGKERMKKMLLVLVLGLVLVTGAVFAEHPAGKTGIGVVFGGAWNGSAYLYPGLSLKLPSMPVYWGIYAHLSQYGFGVGATGDYYFIDSTLVNFGGGSRLGWYLGLGGFADINFWQSGLAFDVGARVPIGLSWFIIPSAELFVDVAPGIGLGVGGGGPGLYWTLPAEIGLRFWL
jgi:hypothetical protein